MMTGKKPNIMADLFIKNIPNLLTLLNMLTGLTVLYLNVGEVRQDYKVLSYTLILIAVMLDAVDGMAARLLGAESEFGKQLDSFADLVSFGIAPIVVLLEVLPIHSRPGILLVLLFYPIAGAFRLARYNLTDDSSYFTGLPITAAGFIQASFGLFINSRFRFFPGWAVGQTVLLTALLSVMMIGNFKVGRIIFHPIQSKSSQNARP
jgi:CDP-diacylglycerol--serine O-phosphatidyltransferase